MTFLSLAKGDPAARAMLGNAIKARYGLRPISLSSLRLEMKAVARGPLGLPATKTISARYVGTSHWRWDQTERLFGITLSRATESYDGGVLYLRNSGKTTSTNDKIVINGVRNRLWLELSIFLTPLTEEDVILKVLDASAFQALPTEKAPELATLHLNADSTLASAEAQCYHPQRGANARLIIRPQDGLTAHDGFTAPVRLRYEWENEPGMTLTIVSAEANPKIPLTEFSIGGSP